MKKRFLTKEPLRWFLLLWVAMAGIGSLLSNVGAGLTPARQHGLAVGGSTHQPMSSGILHC